MDEFAYYSPDAKAGVLHIRELTDDVIMILAQDHEWVSPEFREVYAFMEALRDGKGDHPTNQAWVTGEALTEAYKRGLIDGEQFDHMRREAGL